MCEKSSDVRGIVQREYSVGLAGFDTEAGTYDPRPLFPDGSERQEGIDHDVTDKVDMLGGPTFSAEVLHSRSAL